jgi:hypothetical protein
VTVGTTTITEGNFASTSPVLFYGFDLPISPGYYTIGTLPTCNIGLLGTDTEISNGTAYAVGTYGSAVVATGAVDRHVLCTNTAGPTVYGWAYN